jgi:hypothetical protein
MKIKNDINPKVYEKCLKIIRDIRYNGRRMRRIKEHKIQDYAFKW